MNEPGVKKGVAKVIYLHETGCYPNEYMRHHGVEQEKWEDLPLWRRDDYEFTAEAVLAFLNIQPHPDRA